MSYGTGTTSLFAERFLRTEFVISMNTSHANIRAFLDEGFQQAEKFLNKGERFALEASKARLHSFKTSCYCCCLEILSAPKGHMN